MPACLTNLGRGKALLKKASSFHWSELRACAYRPCACTYARTCTPTSTGRSIVLTPSRPRIAALAYCYVVTYHGIYTYALRRYAHEHHNEHHLIAKGVQHTSSRARYRINATRSLMMTASLEKVRPPSCRTVAARTCDCTCTCTCTCTVAARTCDCTVPLPTSYVLHPTVHVLLVHAASHIFRPSRIASSKA